MYKTIWASRGRSGTGTGPGFHLKIISTRVMRLWKFALSRVQWPMTARRDVDLVPGPEMGKRSFRVNVCLQLDWRWHRCKSNSKRRIGMEVPARELLFFCRCEIVRRVFGARERELAECWLTRNLNRSIYCGIDRWEISRVLVEICATRSD